jgi:hypothetical protein
MIYSFNVKNRLSQKLKQPILYFNYKLSYSLNLTLIAGAKKPLSYKLILSS